VPAQESDLYFNRSSQPKINQFFDRLRRDPLFRRLLEPARRPRELPYFDKPGKVLHLDGDPAYLRKSLEIYERLQIPAEGYYIPEIRMPDALYRLLPVSRPDIVVITGHDGILKDHRDVHNLNNYKNSVNFVKAVNVVRSYERNLDALTVVAGACQSHYEALLQAGANFASSPGRVLIHALDPLYIAVKASYTSVKETINVADVLSNTYSGLHGLGGLETRGSHRTGLPRLKALLPESAQ